MTTVQQPGISAAAEPADPAQNPPLPGTTVGGAVGTFYADFTLWSPDHTRSRTLNGRVDTGVSYTLVPAAILEELGIERFETQTFTLADGSRREMSIGLADLELDGRRRTVYVLFGTEKGPGVLGSMALSAFALAADAKNRRLIPGELTL